MAKATLQPWSSILIDDVRLDGGTQPRELIDQQVVGDYAEAMAAGATFPPVVVFADGAAHWLADGFHRYHAYRRNGAKTIVAEVHNGDVRDAVLYAAGANTTHGLRRSNADKRRAVLRLLEDDEWGKWSDNKLAKICGVGHQLVAHCRASLDESSSEPPRTYTTKHGTPATMNTAKIGRKRGKKRGGIAKNAFLPVRDPKPRPYRTNVDLELDPKAAARTIIQVFGREYAVDLSQEIAKQAIEAE